MDTSVICSLHQWCSLQPGRWWRVIKLWVSSIFHKDAPTHSAHNLHMKLLFTWIKTYSIFNYCLLPMSPAAHIGLTLQQYYILFLIHKAFLFPPWQIFLQQGPAAALCCRPCSWSTAVTSQCQHQTLASHWSPAIMGWKYIWPPLENSVSLGTSRKKIFSGNERLSYFLTHWHLISC